jgi:hypothetical protein
MMRKLGAPCETCYSGRPARWRIDYDSLGMCWVCKLRTHAPRWLCRIIDRYDHAGFARYEAEAQLASASGMRTGKEEPMPETDETGGRE